MLILNDESLSQQAATVLQGGIRNTVEKYIESLGTIMQAIASEILDEADMSPTRYGNPSPYMSRELANMQVNYSTMSNIIASITYSRVRANLYEALIDYSKIAWIEGKRGTILNEGIPEIMDIDGIEHYNDNIGIFVKDIAQESQQVERIKQLADRAAANNNYELMLEFITNDDIPSLKKTAKDLGEAEREFKREMEAYSVQAEEVKQQAQREQQEHEAKLIQFKEEQATARQDSINETQLIINGMAQQANRDKASAGQSETDKQKQADNKTLQREKMQQQERKMQAQERIAAMNKN